MQQWKENVILVMMAVIYLLASFFWEKAMFRIIRWWGEQFIALRPTLTSFQSIEYTIIALFFVLVVIPHFLWLPVTLFKELKSLLNEDYQRNRVLA